MTEEKSFEELAREVFLRDAALRESFIIEELKPFLIKEGDELIYTCQLRVRLAEIEDYKQRVRDFIRKMQEYDKEHGQNYYAPAYSLLWKELGL